MTPFNYVVPQSIISYNILIPSRSDYAGQNISRSQLFHHLCVTKEKIKIESYKKNV